jgi:WD40 repeat protein
MKTRFFIMLVIELPVLAIFGCGGDEEVIQLIKTDPPDGGELGNFGTLTMTFDGEPTEVTIELPGGSKTVRIIGKTATYTFTTEDGLVLGNNVPIGISWVSKGGSTGGKIVKFTIVPGGDGVGKVKPSECPSEFRISNQPIAHIGNDSEILDIVFSPDGRSLFAITDEPYTLVQYNTATLQEVGMWNIKGIEDYPSLAISPDGKNLAIGTYAQLVLIWDIKAQKITKTLQVEDERDEISDVAYSPDGRLLAAVERGDYTILWNAQTYERIAILGQNLSGRQLAFSPDSQFLAVDGLSYEWVIRVWDTKTLQVAFVIKLEEISDRIDIKSIPFSPDGRFLAVGGGIGEHFEEDVLQLWDVKIRHLVSTLDFPERVDAIAFSPDGCLLACAGGGDPQSFIRVFITRTQQPIATLQMTSGMGYSSGLSFSPDGSILAAGFQYGGILLWKVEHN